MSWQYELPSSDMPPPASKLSAAEVGHLPALSFPLLVQLVNERNHKQQIPVVCECHVCDDAYCRTQLDDATQGIESTYQHADEIPHFRRGSEADRHEHDYARLDEWYANLEASPPKKEFDFAVRIPGVTPDDESEGSGLLPEKKKPGVEALKELEEKNK